MNIGIVALEGLLYAVGGCDIYSYLMDSVEVYNPISNTWTMLGNSLNIPRRSAGLVAIERPLNFWNLSV